MGWYLRSAIKQQCCICYGNYEQEYQSVEHNELEHESHAAQSVEGIPSDLDGAKGSVVPIRLIS